MSIEGIWTGEVHGPYGWEESGVYVLQNGQVMGGNNRHFSIGTYTLSGNSYNADISVHYYGPPRAIFGEKAKDFEISVKGEMGDGMIDAQVERRDRPQFAVEFHMTKRMDLPAKVS